MSPPLLGVVSKRKPTTWTVSFGEMPRQKTTAKEAKSEIWSEKGSLWLWENACLNFAEAEKLVLFMSK